MNYLEEIDDVLIEDEENIVNHQRKIYNTRNRFRHQDNFNSFDDMEFYMRYRLSKDSVLFILEQIRHELEPRTQW